MPRSPATYVPPILEEAGKILLPHYGNISHVEHKGTRAPSVVTQFDTEVEKLLSKRLKEADPSIGFAGEETGGERTGEAFWLADPIDGTAHFVRGIPFCTIMLSLIEEHDVKFSAIYNFTTKEMYIAEKGKGAHCNGKPLHVSSRPLWDSYMGLEASKKGELDIELHGKVSKRCVVVRTISAGYEACLIASGRIEGKITLNPFGKDYDYAPGNLLIKEAGGTVANIG